MHVKDTNNKLDTSFSSVHLKNIVHDAGNNAVDSSGISSIKKRPEEDFESEDDDINNKLNMLRDKKKRYPEDDD